MKTCQHERRCDECGEAFWGGARANFCSAACRSRRWRAKQTRAHAIELAALCGEVALRRDRASASYGKLVPALFRAAAAELRRRGWDPIELLLSMPAEPAGDSDDGGQGVAGQTPARRRWLHPPEQELDMLERLIPALEAQGLPVTWQRQRCHQLKRHLEELAQPGAPSSSASGG